MKFVRMLISDIRNRKNLDGYILAFGAIVITVLGMLGIVDETIVSSAILAVLVFISIWLIQNRHENTRIQTALSSIDNLHALFREIALGLGTSVVFEVVQRGKHVPFYKGLLRLVSQAKREVLILDYVPLSPDDAVHPDDVINEARQSYHRSLIDKVRSKKSNFKYRRIVQLPKNSPISDLFKNDLPFRRHCKEIIELEKNQEENISLQRSEVLFHGTIIIIDRERLIVSIDITDPDDKTYIDPGIFQFYDPKQEIIKVFVKYFERAYVKATLVKPEELR